MRRLLVIACLFVGLLVPFTSVHGSSGYADPAFLKQWQSGEAITPNFWGPLGTAQDGQQEPYKEAPGGQRLVQYFDKGRMELTNGTVTNGLLASEIVKGQVQVGVATFQSRPAPSIPIAGDPDNPGPTYAALATTAVGLLASASSQMGSSSFASISAGGVAKPADVTASGRAAIGAYDDATKHNVPGVFADYRDIAGVRAIGLAISEPFAATVKVAGNQKTVLVQVFERRVLTYTPDNPPAFQVEMGNIGQHYYQWRYQAGISAPSTLMNPAPAAPIANTTPTSTPAPTPSLPPAPVQQASLGTTYNDPDGAFSIQFSTDWHVIERYSGHVLLSGPNNCAFDVSSELQASELSLDDHINIWKGIAVPSGPGLGATQPITIGGEPGKMFIFRREGLYGDPRAYFGMYAVAAHKGKVYTVDYTQDFVPKDTCRADGRAMLASFRFTDGSTAPPSSRIYSTDLNCSDFASQADAQAYLRLYPDDPSDLDANHVGIACDTNKAPFDKTPVAVTNIPASTYTGGSSSTGGCTSNCSVYVSGYTKKNGTYVAPYYRSPPHHK